MSEAIEKYREARDAANELADNLGYSEKLAVVCILLIKEGIDYKLRLDYSGRGMYGKLCVGIVLDEPAEVIAHASAVLLPKCLQDSMGTQSIVYWPSIKPTEELKYTLAQEGIDFETDDDEEDEYENDPVHGKSANT